MERFCFTMGLYAGREAEYERRHAEIWPELVEAIQGAGVRNYTLFRRGREVIAYCECHPDVATCFGALAESDVNARWSKWFEDVIEDFSGEDGEMHAVREVWHMS